MLHGHQGFPKFPRLLFLQCVASADHQLLFQKAQFSCGKSSSGRSEAVTTYALKEAPLVLANTLSRTLQSGPGRVSSCWSLACYLYVQQHRIPHQHPNPGCVHIPSLLYFLLPLLRLPFSFLSISGAHGHPSRLSSKVNQTPVGCSHLWDHQSSLLPCTS